VVSSEITPYFLSHPWIDFKVSGERAASVSNAPSVEVKLLGPEFSVNLSETWRVKRVHC
jgi:hypothetical protein